MGGQHAKAHHLLVGWSTTYFPVCFSAHLFFKYLTVKRTLTTHFVPEHFGGISIPSSRIQACDRTVESPSQLGNCEKEK